jgi:hypothetical protein
MHLSSANIALKPVSIKTFDVSARFSVRSQIGNPGLIPSTIIVVLALDLGAQAFKIEGCKEAIAALNARVGEIGKIDDE